MPHIPICSCTDIRQLCQYISHMNSLQSIVWQWTLVYIHFTLLTYAAEQIGLPHCMYMFCCTKPFLTNADGVQTKHTYQASKSVVSDFIHHYITANPNNTWNQLKNEFSAGFSEVQDSQHAFTLLRWTKQKLSETVQVYAERLFALAQEAFAGQKGVLVQWRAKWLVSLLMDFIMTFLRSRLWMIIQSRSCYCSNEWTKLVEEG